MTQQPHEAVSAGAGAREILSRNLTPEQAEAMSSPARWLLILAGAGSGKTEVMGRRVGWWTAVDDVPRERIVAFTFTERAAEELKFRIRRTIQTVTPSGADATLGGMYVGTMHGFCVELLRRLRPDEYHNYDVLGEQARFQLVDRVFDYVLGLRRFQNLVGGGRYNTLASFLEAYDLLNEYDELAVRLAAGPVPTRPGTEVEWCKAASLVTDVGASDAAQAFAVAAARYYAYQRSRRFLDFSTSQTESLRVLADRDTLERVRIELTHYVLDEVQDVNPVQDRLVRLLVGDEGHLTAVGDHRQAIFGWRGAQVDLMAVLYEQLRKASDGDVVELRSNFRSTPRIIHVANEWARTIGRLRSMPTPDMTHGNSRRMDDDPSHVRAAAFGNRLDEAQWIASAIRWLVTPDNHGARHDGVDGDRGLALSDIAVLIRSSTDARTYMRALEAAGIPAVFRAGPDLFSQPEVMLFLALLGKAAGDDQFVGGGRPTSLPSRVQAILGVGPTYDAVIPASVLALRNAGLPVSDDLGARLLAAATLIQRRLQEEPVADTDVRRLTSQALRTWLRQGDPPRRVFPQQLFQLLLSEAAISKWDVPSGRGSTAMFHLGQLSSMVTSLETPGWTAVEQLRYQIRAMAAWGAENARIEEAPLRVQPDAVTIGTVHSVKGLEYAAVFVADVNSRRFPNQFAGTPPRLPLDGPILRRLNPAGLADNANRDGERRLMYVALTRAERFLSVSCNDGGRSTFFTAVAAEVVAAGGVSDNGTALPEVSHLPTSARFEPRLITSFSDLRYFLECPHDFYLRKVLGFSPTIDQAFGYGRGVHNLMRSIHSDPARWAALASDRRALEAALQKLVDSGLFYLRYSTGQPAENMQKRGIDIVADYVATYATELERLTFDPERPFETMIPEVETLVAGVIDVIRTEEPPRVTLLDFKSGEAASDIASKLDEEEMRLQVSLYGLAAKHELEYEPERGLVRYLGEDDSSKRELQVPLDDESLRAARSSIIDVATKIRARDFHRGPTRAPRDKRHKTRCGECDWVLVCGHRVIETAR